MTETQTEATPAHINGVYRSAPWGYAGMGVRIYRAKTDGTLWGMRDVRGVIASASTADALERLARVERWVPAYRHADGNGRETWVTIPC